MYGTFLLPVPDSLLHQVHELPDARDLSCQVEKVCLSDPMVFMGQEVPVGDKPDHLL